MTGQQLITFFQAKVWTVERTIFDHRNQKQLSFKGNARFLSKASHYWYEENGELVDNNCTHLARRCYVYQVLDDEIQVSFDNGRPFYLLSCKFLPTASFAHRCDSDEYLGNLFWTPDAWKMRWTIRGPKKHASIVTIYS